MSNPSATVVLVHGAWHGPWCWDRVVDGLARHEVEAVAVDLPGHGADPGPFGDPHSDARRVPQASPPSEVEWFWSATPSSVRLTAPGVRNSDGRTGASCIDRAG